MQQVSAPAIQTAPSMPQANALALNDIHVPEQISNFPIAYGWWLLAAFITLLIIFSIVKIKKASKLNQVKKQALGRLKNNPDMSISDTLALIKWAAMHYFSRAELAKLYGDSLRQFLTSKLPYKHQDEFTELSEQGFIKQYHSDRSQVDKNLRQAATLWLNYALPPKALKATKKRISLNENIGQGVNA